MPACRLVMLDWNGTLLDDLHICYLGVTRIFEHFNLKPPSLEDYRNNVTSDILSFYHERGVPKNVTLADLNVIYKAVVEKNWERVDVARHIYEVIKRLRERGIKLAIITMENDEIMQRRLLQFGLLNKFDLVVSRVRNKAEVMKTAMENFGVKPNEAFYVGDTVSDVEEAKKAGVVSIAYTGGFNSREKLEAAKPDFLIDDLWDVWLKADERQAEGGGA